MNGDDQGAPVEIPDRLLRSALEFAVDIAAAGAKLRPPNPHPPGLKPYLRLQRLPPAALGRIRRAVEDDPEFRGRLGTAASPDLVDELGILWLRRSPGWEEGAAAIVRAAEPHVEIAVELRREQRRRESAERAAARAADELAAALAEIERLRLGRHADAQRAAELAADATAARARVEELDASLRRARADAARAAAAEAEAGAALAAATERATAAEAARDAALAHRAHGASSAAPAADVTQALAEVARLVQRATTGAADLQLLLARLAALAGSPAAAPGAGGSRPGAVATPRRRQRPKRTPIAIPGGLFGDSAAVAEHLLRVPGAQVLVDGYNVAKLGWPALDLAHQRKVCIDAAERVARRWGTLLTVVFDGASVMGATAPGRRLVRVVFSPDGVSADDVLRSDVAGTPPGTPVVVVTNDQAVVTDVRAMGANTVSSEQFLAVAMR